MQHRPDGAGASFNNYLNGEPEIELFVLGQLFAVQCVSVVEEMNVRLSCLRVVADIPKYLVPDVGSPSKRYQMNLNPRIGNKPHTPTLK